MPKVEEFYHFKKDGAPRGAHAAQARALRVCLCCASETIILGILAHLLLKALFIDLKLYYRELNVFLKSLLTIMLPTLCTCGERQAEGRYAGNPIAAIFSETLTDHSCLFMYA